MKHKKRFPGLLLPLRKPILSSFLPKLSRQQRYAAALLLLWLLVFLFATCRVQAQVTGGIAIGQPVPEVPLPAILHKTSRLTHLSDLKGKLVILDFWATWCGSCIAALPKMEALQQQFGPRLHILAVTYEKRAQIESFFRTKTDPQGRPYHFATVVGDTTLTRLFPHRFIPHLVWIGPNGQVLAITGAEEVNAQRIAAVLQSQQVSITAKVDVDPERPLFAGPQLALDSLSFYSVFTKGHYPGLGSGTRFRQADTLVYGRAFTNAYLQDIYVNVAYPLFEQRHDVFSSKRLLIQVAQPSKLIRPKVADGSWSTADEYNYEFRVPLALRNSLYSYLLADLNRYTGYQARIEARLTDCLVLVRSDSSIALHSAGGPAINTAFSSDSKFLNCPLRYLVNNLNELMTFPQPVLDETGFTGTADLRLSTRPDLPTLNRELAVYGLQLRPARRVVNFLVITDNPRAASSFSDHPLTHSTP